MKVRKFWYNKRYGKSPYIGSYAWGFISNPHTERVFVLKTTRRNGKEHLCVFESHEAAKAFGWRKR